MSRYEGGLAYFLRTKALNAMDGTPSRRTLGVLIPEMLAVSQFRSSILQGPSLCKGGVLRRDLQAASAVVKLDGLVFRAFPGSVIRCSRPYLYITFYAAQVGENDKKSKVWLSKIFELQEFLIFLLSLPMWRKRSTSWLISGWTVER